jgi:hypothetical protein
MITFQKAGGQAQGTRRALQKILAEKPVLKEAIDAIFTSRGEPVPFNFLLSLLDMQLAMMGYLPPDMHQSLDRFLHDEPAYAWTESAGWFFKDAIVKGRDSHQPLHARLNDEITRIIPIVKIFHGQARLETMINEIFSRFNGILTPELRLLKKAIAGNGFTTP